MDRQKRIERRAQRATQNFTVYFKTNPRAWIENYLKDVDVAVIDISPNHEGDWVVRLAGITDLPKVQSLIQRAGGTW
jgi:hypothetical protein